MKKILFFVCVTLIFISSCTSDQDLRTINLQEFTFVEPSNCESSPKIATLFSIVPGEYTLNWEKAIELPQDSRYRIDFTLKLHLNNHVELLDKFKTDQMSVNIPFEFYFTDENGKKMDVFQYGLDHFNIAAVLFNKDNNFISDYNKEGTDKDQYMNFCKFLESSPGTEMEFKFQCSGMQTMGKDCIKDIESIKGVGLEYTKNEEYFERDCGNIK